MISPKIVYSHLQQIEESYLSFEEQMYSFNLK